MSHLILLVEDSPDVRLILTDLLCGSHYTVEAVEDGQTGLQQASAKPFDLMILDVMLPDINGKAVCELIRSDPTMSDIKIICISGMVEEDKIEDLKAAGANDFLHKPFEVETLIERMCQLLDIEVVTNR